MAMLLDVVKLKYEELVEFFYWAETIADKRTEDWLFVKSPVPILLCSAAYLFFVWLGPKAMHNRKAFDLKPLMIVYNLSMAVLNAYICVNLFISARVLNYSYICQPVTNSKDPYLASHEINIASALWWYFISKLLEYADTAFFVLRKRNSQLSFLHVYHHCSMFCFWWIGLKWVPGGSPFVMGMLNSFVHVLMYTYYGLSAFGPWMNKYLWWKKYLTMVQLVQFTTAIILAYSALTVGCDFPKWMAHVLVVYMISLILLFSNFYYNAYTKGKRMREFVKEGESKKRNIPQENGHLIDYTEMSNGEKPAMNGHTKNTEMNNHVQNGQLHIDGMSVRERTRQ